MLPLLFAVLSQRVRRCVEDSCMGGVPTAAHYARMVMSPQRVSSTRAAFVMNVAGHGHMELSERFSSAVGLRTPKRGLAAAKRLLADSVPFAYLTLTNDHLKATELGHDNTLRWERTIIEGQPGMVRFIGPPGFYTDEASRKKEFCRWSEELHRVHRSLRFSLPCATGEAIPGHYVGDYKQLIGEEERAARAKELPPPRWLVRTLRGKNRVIAFGAGMRLEVLPSNRVESMELQPGKSLLLRFLDPPLLQRGAHLGVPVATRFEVRFHGLVQWQPLRVWVAGHGFVRSGSPWWNYSSTTNLDESNRLMWELSAAPDPSCRPLPRERAPWVSAVRYDQCKKSKASAKRESQPDGCCICQTVGDTLDIENGEEGFATSGTLLKVEQIARANGVHPHKLWRNADEAMNRYLIMQQRAWVKAANGSTLARWHTPFSMDVAFGADGRAWIYDSHLLPTWKRPGHWHHRHIDRGNALGLYSSLMLAMSHLLMPLDKVNHLHRPLVQAANESAHHILLEFLRDQGLASVLGFRRAWPSPRHEMFQHIASPDDTKFARLVDSLGLLSPMLDSVGSHGHARRRADLLVKDEQPMWGFNGLLYANASKPLQCEDARRILDSWRAAAGKGGRDHRN